MMPEGDVFPPVLSNPYGPHVCNVSRGKTPNYECRNNSLEEYKHAI
jgi:hypothetical protein